jgi:type VI secretion system secreted protein VgrG
MAGYTQNNRILAFNSPLGPNKLLAMAFGGVEEISEIFDYYVDVLSELETLVVPSALVGKRVALELQVTDTGTKRYFNGIVRAIEGTGGDTYFNSYRLWVVPMLWLLSLNRQTRVFQDLSVLEIARKILEPYSIVPQLQIQSSYPVLEYCTQYRETDLHFLQRILQQQGIFFYFTHSISDHLLVLSDSSQLSGECEIVSDLDFVVQQERQLSFYRSAVQDFRSRSSLVPGEHSSWDYRFTQYAVSHAGPVTAHAKAVLGDNSHELYDYADSANAFFKTEAADARTPQMQTLLQNVQRDLHDASSIECEGASTASTLQAGFTFTLHKYPQEEKNVKYLVTRVVHQARQQPGYRAELRQADEEPYRNTFQAKPFQQIYRKAITLAKPRVHGVVTGKVVTLPGEDSYLDRFGRVCVQFWWDRSRPPQTPDKTLLRVAQQWAGKGWGTYFWPRVGDEVLIDFIEGDPDAPIVIGSVYNGINMPKYDPRTEYTRSGILTRSSRGGSSANANELRFEDRLGAEQIFLNAERDMDHRVEHEHRRFVGANDHLIVRGDRLGLVEGSSQQEVQGNSIERVVGRCDRDIEQDSIERIGGEYSLKVEKNLAIKVGTTYSLDADTLCTLKGSAGIVLESEAMIRLQVGSTSLTVTPAGVIVSGAIIPLTGVASAPIPQIPAPMRTPAQPQRPDEADDGTKGGKL